MSKDQWLSPADIAKQLGLTVKALRVYEREGLVQPHRLSTGWRVYGPAQAQNLHAVIALRGLGFTLKHIKSLMDGGAVDLGAMLALQRQALLDQRTRLGTALDRLTSVQHRLAQGHVLSLDDLIQLTKETQMSIPQANSAFRETYTKILEERLPDGEAQTLLDNFRTELAASQMDLAALKARYKVLGDEAKAFMDCGDETSDAVKDLVRRWVAASPIKNRPSLRQRDALRAAFDGATQDPDILAAMPFDVEVSRFVGRILRAMMANGDIPSPNP